MRNAYKDCLNYGGLHDRCIGEGGQGKCKYCPAYYPFIGKEIPPATQADYDFTNQKVLRDPTGKSPDVPMPEKNVRAYNVGTSDYSTRTIQPWDIWLEYNLDPWEADIIKRVLRHKENDSRRLDFEKIKHVCDEIIRQFDAKER